MSQPSGGDGALCIVTRHRELEEKVHEPAMPSHAQRMSQRLEALDADFRTHHMAVINAMGDEDTDKEQEILDAHDDKVGSLSYRLEQLSRIRAPGADTSDRTVATRRLSQLDAKLSTLSAAIGKLSGDAREVLLVHLYEEQLHDCKGELGGIQTEVLSLITGDSDELNMAVLKVDQGIFDLSLQVKRLLYNPDRHPETPTPSSETRGVKLPKIDVPMFDGDILHWQIFGSSFLSPSTTAPTSRTQRSWCICITP